MSPLGLFRTKLSVLSILVVALVATVGCSPMSPTFQDRLDALNEFVSALKNPHVRARLIQYYLEEEIRTTSARPSPVGGASQPGSGTGFSNGTGQEPSGNVSKDEFVVDVAESGLLATVPGYAEADVSTLQQLAEEAGLEVREGDILQVRVLLTRDDRWFLVVTRDDPQTVFVTAGTVRGVSVPLPEGLPDELRWLGGVIVADDVVIDPPQTVTPTDVIGEPSRFGLRRVSMDTTYLFGGARIKDAPDGLDKLGFGQTTDALGSSDLDDYLTVVDPYNNESQIRVAQVTGTVLYPTEGVRRLLEELYRFSPDDLREALDRPAVFYETLNDDEAQLVSIESLAPTPSDPRSRLGSFHGEVVSVEGIALGTMIRTEDVPKLDNMPVHVTLKGFAIADASGAMPVFAISSLDESGEIFGHFRVELSIYRFDDGKAFAFLVGMESVPLDPVKAITDAGFGDPVSLSLGTYTLFHLDSVSLGEDLTITDVDLLIPGDTSEPIIFTRLDAIATGAKLSNVEADGHFIGDPDFLGSAMTSVGHTSSGNAGIVLAEEQDIRVEIGAGPGTLPDFGF